MPFLAAPAVLGPLLGALVGGGAGVGTAVWQNEEQKKRAEEARARVAGKVGHARGVDETVGNVGSALVKPGEDNPGIAPPVASGQPAGGQPANPMDDAITALQNDPSKNPFSNGVFGKK